jgi:thiol-disulfide isomerase/thioredoxin
MEAEGMTMKIRTCFAALLLLAAAAAVAAPQATKITAVRDPEIIDARAYEKLIEQFRGKPVLVNFWATWCEPCRFEIPWLIEMQQKYAAKGFTVVGIAMDEEGRSVVSPFVEKERFDVNGNKAQMNYPIVLGNDATADKFGGLFGYPTSVLIGRDGKVIQRITGLISYEEISKTIELQL